MIIKCDLFLQKAYNANMTTIMINHIYSSERIEKKICVVNWPCIISQESVWRLAQTPKTITGVVISEGSTISLL